MAWALELREGPRSRPWVCVLSQGSMSPSPPAAQAIRVPTWSWTRGHRTCGCFFELSTVPAPLDCPSEAVALGLALPVPVCISSCQLVQVELTLAQLRVCATGALRTLGGCEPLWRQVRERPSTGTSSCSGATCPSSLRAATKMVFNTVAI